MAVSHTWDAAGRETLLQNISAAGIGQAIFTNTYSPVNNRLTVAELDGTLCTFGFDSTSQLISEARSGTYAYNRSYAWDPLGNRLQQYDSGALTQRTFNAANEMLTIIPASGSPTTQVFDANGNLTVSTTGSAVTTNTWSAENALLSQISPTVNEQYLYGQDGLRRQKINSSGTTLFALDGPNVLIETTAAGALQARNTQNPNGYGGLVSQNRSSASSFYGFDSQQSTRILVSVGGLITDSLSFKMFGEELQTGSGTVNPFWYGGQVGYFRDLPGVVNAGWRKLVAANGTWLNRDLIGLAGGDVNLYRYVGNEPVSAADPTGRLQYEPVNPANWAVGYCGQPDQSKNCCGRYVAQWLFWFDTTGKDSRGNPTKPGTAPCDGWVIQENYNSFGINPCKPPYVPSKPKTYVFWEAWYYIAGNSNDVLGGDYTDQASQDRQPGTWGYTGVSKNAKSFCDKDGVVTDALLHTWGFFDESDTCSNITQGLPCTSRPAMAATWAALVPHEVGGPAGANAEWACCDCTTSPPGVNQSFTDAFPIGSMPKNPCKVCGG